MEIIHFVIYVVIFLLICIFLLLIKLFKHLSYRKSFVYYSCIEDAILHLAHNLKHTTNSGGVYSVYSFKSKLKYIYKKIKKLQANYQISLDKIIFSNIEKLLFCANKINISRLVYTTHSNNKLRVFEITLMLLDYIEKVDLIDIENAIKSFNNITPLKYDELTSVNECVILALIYDLDNLMQEYIKYRDFKNKAKFEAQDAHIKQNKILDNIKVKIINALNIINNIKRLNLNNIHVLSNKGLNKDELIEINNISKRLKVSEIEVYDKIVELKSVLDKSFSEILFEHYYSIKLQFKRKKIKFEINSLLVYRIQYFLFCIIFDAIATFVVSFAFMISIKTRLIILNYLAFFRLSKIVNDKYFSIKLTKKCFTKMKNRSILIKSVNLVSIFSYAAAIALFAAGFIFKDNMLILNSTVTIFIYPIIYFGEKFSFYKNLNNRRKNFINK